jgi:hypothetical protein
MAGAGYKLFNTGDVLTAAQVNTYLNEQTVMVFASSAARTSALSGVLAEGMMSYLQDTNSVEVYNGTAWVSVGGGGGDVTEVQAGVGISVASGTGPIPIITNSSTDLITTAGDLLYGTAADTVARLGIGTAGQVLKVNSGATAPEWGAAAAGGFVGAVAYKSASAQSIANATDTIVTFDAEEFDTDGFHSTSVNTGRMTIPAGKGGKYLCIGNVIFAANATGQRSMNFAKNGSSAGAFQQLASAGSGTSTIFCISGILDLVATDYVEISVFQNSTGSLNVNNNQAGTRFAIQYLGA